MTRTSHRLHLATDSDTVSNVLGNARSTTRSGCPVSAALEVLGDRWTLLIVRDLMVRGFQSFKQFKGSGESIATNILSDRLRKLESAGIVTAEAETTDGRKINYRLTEKGIDLAPVLMDLLLWGARYEKTSAPRALVAKMQNNREEFLAEVRRHWQTRNLVPLLPNFTGKKGA